MLEIQKKYNKISLYWKSNILSPTDVLINLVDLSLFYLILKTAYSFATEHPNVINIASERWIFYLLLGCPSYNFIHEYVGLLFNNNETLHFSIFFKLISASHNVFIVLFYNSPFFYTSFKCYALLRDFP